MGWRDVLRHPIQALRKTNDDRPVSTPYFARRTYSKIPVTHDTALSLSTVWACVSAITQPLAYMSCHVMQPKRGGGSQFVPGSVDWILNTQANPDMTAFTFRETLTAWALTWGNGYAEIEQDGAGRTSWTWPISPDRVNPDRTQDGELVYDIINKRQPNVVLPASKVFHLHGLGFDGVMGYSVIALARQSIGLGLATEKFGAEFFGNGLHPGGVAEHPGKLGPQARKNIQESLREQVKDAHDVLVLEEGMKWNKTTIPPEDAQFLETRQFQVPEICRWFRVPPHKVADLSRSTFANIEHQAIEFVTDSLVPWVKRWETEADVKLFGANRGAFFTKFNVNSLLRGDQASRSAAYNSAVMTGYMTINEVRELEDMNPLPPAIGDVIYRPLNMQVVSVRNGRILSPQPVLPEPTEPALPPAQQAILESAILAAQLNGNGHHAPDIHVHVANPSVHTAAPPVTNNFTHTVTAPINVPPQHVTVENQFTAPPAEVNVDARTTVHQQPVTVENVVHTPPAEVNVDARVNAPVTISPPHITVENQVPAMLPTAEVNVDARTTVHERPVNVENTVTVPEREVNIDARTTVNEQPVKVENTVNVPERQVTVENQVNVPQAETHVDNRIVLPSPPQSEDKKAESDEPSEEENK